LIVNTVAIDGSGGTRRRMESSRKATREASVPGRREGRAQQQRRGTRGSRSVEYEGISGGSWMRG
jgi:hypothetical protein